MTTRQSVDDYFAILTVAAGVLPESPVTAVAELIDGWPPERVAEVLGGLATTLAVDVARAAGIPISAGPGPVFDYFRAYLARMAPVGQAFADRVLGLPDHDPLTPDDVPEGP